MESLSLTGCFYLYKWVIYILPKSMWNISTTRGLCLFVSVPFFFSWFFFYCIPEMIISLGRKAIATVIFLLPVLPGQNVSFGQKHTGQNRAFVEKKKRQSGRTFIALFTGSVIMSYHHYLKMWGQNFFSIVALYWAQKLAFKNLRSPHPPRYFDYFKHSTSTFTPPANTRYFTWPGRLRQEIPENIKQVCLGCVNP